MNLLKKQKQNKNSMRDLESQCEKYTAHCVICIPAVVRPPFALRFFSLFVTEEVWDLIFLETNNKQI